MRTGQMQALANTREVKGHPFDAVDMVFGLLSAVSGSPVAFGLAVAQYFARRSAWVAETLLEALDLPPMLEDSRALRVMLPGVAKALPAPAVEEQAGEGAVNDDGTPTPARVLLSTEQWRAALDESPHLLIYGPSKAGKSTLAQAVVAMFHGCEYVVIDPQPNKPGERKWGGVDFVTLDEEGGDEYASVRAALIRVQDEDARRRRRMRVETPTPLVVIIDEVLQLKDALGIIINEQGKKEPRIAHFIRTMGYSSRHRNIKIILIGQGKNLSDLGLDSSTARNNYALVRAARNVATNTRAAYIEADGDEQPINLQHVLKLAGSIGSRARVWLRHVDLAPAPALAAPPRRPVQPVVDDLLSSLLALPPPEKRPETRLENFQGAAEISKAPETSFQAQESGVSNFPEISKIFSRAEIDTILAEIRAGKTQTAVIRSMPRYSGRVYKDYTEYYRQLKQQVDREGPRRVAITSSPDEIDPAELVPAAFAGIFEALDATPPAPAQEVSDEEFFERLGRLTLAQLQQLRPANDTQRGALAFAIQQRRTGR